MKNKYGIGFFVISILSIFILTCAYQLSRKYTLERAEEKTRLIQEEQAAREEEESIAAEGTALKEDCYYLMEVNGYVVVYLSDKKTPYEYTDIRYDDLPDSLREEIRNGKYMEGIEELYGFLENYTS